MDRDRVAGRDEQKQRDLERRRGRQIGTRTRTGAEIGEHG